MHKVCNHGVLAATFLAAGGIAPGLPGKAAAYTESVLYDFCSTGGFDCTDGENPGPEIIADKSGNLYSITENGGAYGVRTEAATAALVGRNGSCLLARPRRSHLDHAVRGGGADSPPTPTKS
jgi:hypothetical protein